MTTSLYKLLQFEFKQNYVFWFVSLITFISISTFLSVQKYIGEEQFQIKGTYLPLLFLFVGIITLHSYSESTSKQSMIMYHLLPLSRRNKFFTKQLITLFIVPAILFTFYLVLALVIHPLLFGKSNTAVFSPNQEPYITVLLFLWFHAFATFFAILFKKRKLLYTFLVFAGFQLSTMIVVLILTMIRVKNDDLITPSSILSLPDSAPFAFGITIIIGLYITSYYLFNKRQL